MRNRPILFALLALAFLISAGPHLAAAGETIKLPAGRDFHGVLGALRPDTELLLEYGVTYDVAKGKVPTVRADGVTIGAYGDPAKGPPRVASESGGLFASKVKRLTVRDVQFKPRPIGRGDGLVLRDVADLVLERVVVNEHAQGIVIQGVERRGLRARVESCRVFDNADAGDGKGQGIYASSTDGLVVRGSLLVGNGWLAGRVASNELSHNLYVHQSCGPAVVEGNVIADGSSHGAQVRPGGPVRGNVFCGNPVHLSVGLVNGTGAPVAGGVPCDVDGNVFVGPSRPIDGIGILGWGVELANLKAGARVTGNLVAHEPGGDDAAFQIKRGTAQDNSRAVGIPDLRFEGNFVWDRRGAVVSNTLERSATPGNGSYVRLALQDTWAPPVQADLTKLVNVAACRELLKRPPTARTAADIVERCQAAIADPAVAADMARLKQIPAELEAAEQRIRDAEAARNAILVELAAIRARRGLN